MQEDQLLEGIYSNKTLTIKNIVRAKQFVDQNTWNSYSTIEQRSIINNLIVENASMKIAPRNMMYLKLHRWLGFLYHKMRGEDVPSSIYFNSLYVDEKLLKIPHEGQYVRGDATSGFYLKKDNEWSIPYKAENCVYSNFYVSSNKIFIKPTVAIMSHYFVPFPTMKIDSLFVLDQRYYPERGLITHQGVSAIPSHVLLTLKNGTQLVLKLPQEKEVRTSNGNDENNSLDSVQLDPTNPLPLIIPVGFGSQKILQNDSYMQALYWHKRYQKLQQPSQLINRLFFQRLIFHSPYIQLIKDRIKRVFQFKS